ncbi:hypothetical protein Droror1_Dr00011237 [Drosera rotundifolia]
MHKPQAEAVYLEPALLPPLGLPIYVSQQQALPEIKDPRFPFEAGMVEGKNSPTGIGEGTGTGLISQLLLVPMEFFFLPWYNSDFLYSIAPYIAALVTIAILTLKIRRKESDSRKEKQVPVATTIIHVMLNYHRIHDYITDLAMKHPTARIITPFQKMTATVNPANVKHILLTKFHNYGKGSFNYLILKDIFGDGIFTVDGEKWFEQRKASSLELASKVLRDYSTTIYKEKAIHLANTVATAANLNQTIDIQDLILKSSLDAIFKVTFGVEFDDACSTPEEAAKFGPAFYKANYLSIQRYVDVLWPIKKRLNIGSEATLKKCVEITDHVVYKLIERRAQEIRQSQDSISVTRYDILSRFLYSGETDPKNLRDSTLSFVIPSRDPTSATLAWFFYMLCKQPELQEKLAQEIKNVTKVESAADITEFAENLSDEHLAKMHYLHAVLTETLRLYPSVPMNVKMCFSDDTLPDGYKVNKGDLVFYLPYAMGRMKSIWGDDAEVFRPERWLGKDGNFQPASPFKFTAFQAGPRMCLGKEFAYKQMKIFCAVMISSFTFKLADERKSITYGVSKNLFIKGGLHVCTQRR